MFTRREREGYTITDPYAQSACMHRSSKIITIIIIIIIIIINRNANHTYVLLVFGLDSS